jgi:23S rRNA (uracil1939-C5)-methyltransferase
LELTIEKLIYGGDGLARMAADARGPGKAVFVPFVAAGERIDAAITEEKPGFARAHLDKILHPSAERVEAGCPYFERCGGCHYQHLRYERQLIAKAEILKENLRRIARLELETEVELHGSPPWNYRNRTRLRIRSSPFAIGYYKFRSHDLLPIEQCPISSPLLNRAITAIWKLGSAGLYPIDAGEIELFANAEDRELLIELSEDLDRSAGTSIEQWAAALRAELPELVGVTGSRAAEAPTSQRRQPGMAATTKQVNACSYGASHLLYRTAKFSYRVSAGSFFQVNRFMTDELVDLVTKGLAGRSALDLYAGVGLFSTILAKSIDHIEAVESSQTSFSDLQYNSSANVKAICAPVEQYLHRAAGKLKTEVIVVDPPRGGLGEYVARPLAEIGAAQIRYVSCDPATLARDLKHLLAAGYKVQEAHLVDLFPQTYHLESVLHLAK